MNNNDLEQLRADIRTVKPRIFNLIQTSLPPRGLKHLY